MSPLPPVNITLRPGQGLSVVHVSGSHSESPSAAPRVDPLSCAVLKAEAPVWGPEAFTEILCSSVVVLAVSREGWTTMPGLGVCVSLLGCGGFKPQKFLSL